MDMFRKDDIEKPDTHSEAFFEAAIDLAATSVYNIEKI